MTILDQPIPEDKPAPAKRRWTLFEKIFPPLVLVLALIRELTGELVLYEVLTILGTILALCYLVAYYWIAKPLISTFRTVSITVLYGPAFFLGIIAFLLSILFYPGAKEMIILSGAVILGVLVIDFSSSIRKKPVANRKTAVRIVILGILLVIFYFVPESKHVQFVYRRYAEFVSYYNDHQQDGRFRNIWAEYFKTHPHPSDK